MTALQTIGENIAQLASSPAVLRPLGDLMRHVAPVAKIGKNYFVFNYPDVTTALAADAEFGVTPSYATKMDETSGAFFLGMEGGPRYSNEHGFAEKGWAPGDLERVAKFSGAYAQQLVSRVASTGKIDLVNDFAYHLPLRLLDEYFGVPGPSPDILHRWMQSLFWQLFLNFTDDDTVRDQALQSAREMRPYLSQRVSELKANPNDTFLSRLVQQASAPGNERVDDLTIVRNIGGIIIGAVSTQATSMALAIQELLARPAELKRAHAAALADDDKLVSGYIFEALRFNPHNPLVIRHALKQTVLAEGTAHEHRVAPGERVFAMTISASFDDRGFPNPEKFDPKRPYDRYLHFGYGMHRCFGAQLVGAMMTASLKEILKLPNLRTDQASWRALKRKGPFPSQYDLRFTPTVSG